MTGAMFPSVWIEMHFPAYYNMKYGLYINNNDMEKTYVWKLGIGKQSNCLLILMVHMD